MDFNLRGTDGQSLVIDNQRTKQKTYRRYYVRRRTVCSKFVAMHNIFALCIRAHTIFNNTQNKKLARSLLNEIYSRHRN